MFHIMLHFFGMRNVTILQDQSCDMGEIWALLTSQIGFVIIYEYCYFFFLKLPLFPPFKREIILYLDIIILRGFWK